MATQKGLAGWGRVFGEGEELASEDFEELTRHVNLSRGLGRSYGDSSLPAPGDEFVATSRLADRVLSFDSQTGVVRAEAGLSLHRMNRLFWPAGFASPVAPGTQFITLGGMISADVHGKDHHVMGTFGRHVESMRMRIASGDIVTVSRTEHSDLFRATLGGMGLLGHIVDATFRLQPIPSPWVSIETQRVSDIDAFMAQLKDAARSFPFTMGWIDTLGKSRHLGRGILMRGRFADPSELGSRRAVPPTLKRFRVPFAAPSWLVSRWTTSVFNTLYYHQHIPAIRRGIAHPESFFYPLDSVRDWNLLYGRRGFTQYQCVIPEARGADGVRDFLRLVRDAGGSSMLSVIKDCGDEGEGVLSFPLRGTSIALDLPVDANTASLVASFNALLIELGGRIYLAKDRFTHARDFERMEPRLGAFVAIKESYDPKGRFRSAQSERLGLGGD